MDTQTEGNTQQRSKVVGLGLLKLSSRRRPFTNRRKRTPAVMLYDLQVWATAFFLLLFFTHRVSGGGR